MAPTKPRNCRRCFKQTPATEEIEFSAYGVPYKIPLCGEHVLSFEDDFDFWIRLADELMPFAVPRQEHSRESIRAGTARLRAAKIAADEDVRTTNAANERVAEINAEEAGNTHGWHITEHAELQADALGLGMDKVLMTTLNPARRQPTAAGTEILFSDNCRVVIDPETKDIIDVWILVEADPRGALTPERKAS